MSETRMTNKGEIARFITAGRAKFSIKSNKTGEHMTYSVKTTKYHSSRMFEWAVYHVSATRSIGILSIDRPTGKLKFFPSRFVERLTLPFHWFINHLDDEQVEFWHQGTCGKCGRALTDPESIRRGIGPECAKQFAISEDF